MRQDDRDVGRRRFLSGLGAAAGMVAVGGAGRVLGERGTGRAPAGPPVEARAAQAGEPGDGAGPDHGRVIQAPLGGLRVGDPIGRSTVAAIHPLRMGAVPIVLEGPGRRRFQLDVLRRDGEPGAPNGITTTRKLSIFVVNRGDGRTRTAEARGLDAMALGDRLGALEAAGLDLPHLLTHRERRRRHPVGAFCVPLG